MSRDPATGPARFQTPLPKPWLRAIEAKIGGTSDRPKWISDPAFLKDGMLLDRNESRDPILAAFVGRIVGALPPSVVTDYGDPSPVYAKLAAQLGISVPQFLLASGSEVGIRTVFDAFVGEDDAVVCSSPTYIMVPVYCRQFGARMATVDYRATNQGPALDCEAFCRTIAAHAPKLVYLANPDSPTGTVLSPDEIRRIIEAGGEAGAIVLLDEAYFPFHRHTEIAAIDAYPHLLISRTFSKAWGLAGLRLGLLAGHSALIAHLSKLRQLNEASALSLAVLHAMLDHQAEVDASVARLLEGGTYFVDSMRNLGFRCERTHGNFCLVDFGDRNDRIMRALEGLAVFRPMTHASIAGYQRVTMTTRDRFESIVERIRQA